MDDIDEAGTRTGVDDAGKIWIAMYYADLDEAELWETLSTANAASPDWSAFVAELIELYPGCEVADQYSCTDLQSLVEEAC